MLKGNAIIGQSGGPTSVINASLCGAVQEAFRQSSAIENVFGMQYGIEGFLKGRLLDFAQQPKDVIESLKTTPSSALGSCRYKMKEHDFAPVLEQFKKHNIRYYFLIGGNDTMDTIHRIEKYCKEHGYELRGVGIPKTVDNDLFATDHTPGFASAARYVALSVLQAGILARDMKAVDQYVIFQTVGRSAGWLPASAACAKVAAEDAPHIILVPEKPFNEDHFLDRVKDVHEKHGFVSIVCGEGVCYADGLPVSASQTADKFANIEFGAMGGTSAAMMLHRMINKKFGWRGEFQVTESLQMSAADRASEIDREEAFQCGRMAVEKAVKGTSGVMITIYRESNSPYRVSYGTAPLSDVALGEKPMPNEYIDAENLYVTEACLNYLRPLVGEMPCYGRLF